MRCFTEELRAAKPLQPPEAGRKWRLRKAGSDPLGKIARQVFPDDPNAETVVAVLGGLTEPGACAVLLDAAREAVDAGRLVLIATEQSVTGFGASLRAEHPALGVTVIKTVPTREGLEAAKRFAVAAPGVFREVALDGSSGAAEPAMAPAIPGAEGTFPLGPADVVLVSGMTSPGDLACATALASRGAALAVLARPGPEDPRLAACLAGLRAAGTRVSRKKAELTDPAQVAGAVRSLERGLGPVTAVVHAAVPGPAERCARLSESALRGCLTSQEQRFGSVLAAIAPERLRVLVTFGSITARYGAPGRACEGLAGEMVAEMARRRAGELARCRALHVDWAPWADPGALDPDPDAATPVSVADGSRLLITMLTTPDLPHRVAVHGRLGPRGAFASPTAGPAPTTPAGGPAPAQATGGPAPAERGGGIVLGMHGRFLDTVRVHYPGVELVVDTPLSLQADPYLNDYRMADLPVLPGPMVLEAMGQVASALAGAPQRHVTGVRMAFPVVVPAGEAVIRVCALRRGDAVETVLRCADTEFRVDHARAVFGEARAPEADDSEAATRPANAGAGWPGRHTSRPDGADMPVGGIVDGADLYGTVHFQAGQFRRIAFLPEMSSRGCRALVRGADNKPWFGAVPGAVDVPMILGSPGLNDASLQVLQSCLPHRRWQMDSCESVSFSGDEARGAVEVRAVRRPPAGGETAGTASGSWDVRAIDAAGRTLVAWTGVTLRDLGPLAPAEGWHPTLLAAALEARASDLGIDTCLRATITCGRQPVTVRRVQGDPARAGIAGAEALAPSGDWWDRAVGPGPLDGFELTVRAARPVACRWQAVGSGGSWDPHDEELARLRNQLSTCLPETAEALEARMITLAACLAALGREPAAPCILGDACDSDWIVVRSSGVAAGCAITHISGVPGTVVVSIASRVTETTAMLSNPPGLAIPAGPPTPSGAPILPESPIAPDPPTAPGSHARETHAPGKHAQETHAQETAVSAQGQPPPIRHNTVLQQNWVPPARRSPRLCGCHDRSKQTACRFAA